jgi:mannosyltransferase OCH1-like enzyme
MSGQMASAIVIDSEFEKIDQILLSRKKIIHQIWFDFREEKDRVGTHEFPEKYKKYQQTWLDNNPDWLYVLWDDNMSNQMVEKHFPKLWKVYSKYPTGVQRCDAFRYCLLYRYGGLYVDMDTKCLKPITPLFSSGPWSKKSLIFFEASNAPSFYKLKTGNFAMYSLPGNEFWEKLMKEIINYGTGKWYIPFSLSVINSAGPGMLEWTLEKYNPDIGIIPEKLFPTRIFGSKVEMKNITKEAYAYHFSDVGWRPPGVIFREASMMICIILGVLAAICLALYLLYYIII